MSDEYVVDSSVVSNAVMGKGAVGKAARRLLDSVVAHAPHLIDAEVGSVLRRQERRGILGAEEAGPVGMRMLETIVDHRYPHHGWLATEAWKLRHNMTFYDALYAALAARLDIPLLTSDERLSRAPGLPCRVEVFAA